MSSVTLDLLPNPSTVYGAVSSSLDPVLWIEPGERVVVRTVDVGYGVEPPTDAARKGPAKPHGDRRWSWVRGADRRARRAPWNGARRHAARAGSQRLGIHLSGGGFPTALADELGIGDAEPGVVRWSVDVETGLAPPISGGPSRYGRSWGRRGKPGLRMPIQPISCGTPVMVSGRGAGFPG